jgi:hypothetical protein
MFGKFGGLLGPWTFAKLYQSKIDLIFINQLVSGLYFITFMSTLFFTAGNQKEKQSILASN